MTEKLQEFWIRDGSGNVFGPMFRATVELFAENGMFKAPLEASSDGLEFVSPETIEALKGALPRRLWDLENKPEKAPRLVDLNSGPRLKIPSQNQSAKDFSAKAPFAPAESSVPPVTSIFEKDTNPFGSGFSSSPVPASFADSASSVSPEAPRALSPAAAREAFSAAGGCTGPITQEVPPLRLCHWALSDNSEGLLTLDNGVRNYSVFFRKGRLEALSTTRPDESLVSFALMQKKISEAQLGAVQAEGGDEVDAIFRLGIMDPPVAMELLNQYRMSLLFKAILLSEGTYTFNPNARRPSSAQSLGDGWSPLCQAARAIPRDWVITNLGDRIDRHVMPCGGAHELDIAQLSLNALERRIFSKFDGTRTLVEICDAMPDAQALPFLRTAYLLTCFEAVSFSAELKTSPASGAFRRRFLRLGRSMSPRMSTPLNGSFDTGTPSPSPARFESDHGFSAPPRMATPATGRFPTGTPSPAPGRFGSNHGFSAPPRMATPATGRFPTGTPSPAPGRFGSNHGFSAPPRMATPATGRFPTGTPSPAPGRFGSNHGFSTPPRMATPATGLFPTGTPSPAPGRFASDHGISSPPRSMPPNDAFEASGTGTPTGTSTKFGQGLSMSPRMAADIPVQPIPSGTSARESSPASSGRFGSYAPGMNPSDAGAADPSAHHSQIPRQNSSGFHMADSSTASESPTSGSRNMTGRQNTGASMPLQSMQESSSAMASANQAPADAGKWDAEIAELKKKLSELEGKNHFEVLGVDQSATGSAFKFAFFKLAKKYHPDTAIGAVPEVAQLKSSIFSRMNEAYQVLDNPKRRQEYLDSLNSGGDGKKVDIASILAAEEKYMKALGLMKARRYKDAIPVIEEAMRLNAAEGEYVSARGFAFFMSAGDKFLARQQAVSDINQGLSISPNSAESYVFLGKIEKVSGNDEQAVSAFKKALEISPNNEEAKRELRWIEQKK